jgi:hypothetical protein
MLSEKRSDKNQIVAFELNKPKIYLSINYSKNYIKIVHAINEARIHNRYFFSATHFQKVYLS